MRHELMDAKAFVMIDEVDGDLQNRTFSWTRRTARSPSSAIAGETAPKGRTMGHARALVSGADESAAAKKKVMCESGIHVVDSPATIGGRGKEVLGN